jgi:hypothetical protein
MFFRVAMVAALLLAPLYAQAPAKTETASALPDAREIINRHIKAIGGRQVILSHTSMHATGTLSVPSSGMSGDMEIFAAANPNRLFVRTTVKDIGEIAEGFDGSHAWSVTPMTGPMLKVGKDLQQTKLDADFYGDLRDPKIYPEVKTIEKTTFDSRSCYKVSLKRIDGVEDFEYYDVATGLRAGSIHTRETVMGTMTISTVESGYRKFGNMTQATTLTQQVMGVEQRITLLTLEFDKVPASALEPPAAVKALIK